MASPSTEKDANRSLFSFMAGRAHETRPAEFYRCQMQKPVMKREVGITFASKMMATIHFYATNDALADIQEFGHVEPCGDAYVPGLMCLKVDTRFDFEEVHEYLASYGQ